MGVGFGGGGGIILYKYTTLTLSLSVDLLRPWFLPLQADPQLNNKRHLSARNDDTFIRDRLIQAL